MSTALPVVPSFRDLAEALQCTNVHWLHLMKNCHQNIFLSTLECVFYKQFSQCIGAQHVFSHVCSVHHGVKANAWYD